MLTNSYAKCDVIFAPPLSLSEGRRSRRSGGFVIAAIVSAVLVVGLGLHARAAEPARAAPGAHHTSVAIPIFKIVEGAKGSADPYTPRVLQIPVGRTVALDITDHIGGCALVTVFPGLGVDGETVRARVPVGQTRRVLIRAAKPGRYRYHCAGEMYFGEILAR